MEVVGGGVSKNFSFGGDCRHLDKEGMLVVSECQTLGSVRPAYTKKHSREDCDELAAGLDQDHKLVHNIGEKRRMQEEPKRGDSSRHRHLQEQQDLEGAKSVRAANHLCACGQSLFSLPLAAEDSSLE